MKLIDNPKTNKLYEAFQANEMKFAFATETPIGDWQLIHTWVQCREYFNELLMKNYHSDEFSFDEVHGFQYEHDKFPMDLSRTVIALKFPSKDSMNMFIHNLSVLHTIEEINDVADRTVIHQATTHDRTILVIASKFWIQKALLLNIYTLVLKAMCFDIKKSSINTILKHFNATNTRQPSELSYISSITTKKVNALLNNLTVIADIPTKYVDGSDKIRSAYTIHAWSGILSFVNFANNMPAHFKQLLPVIVKCLEPKPTTKVIFS